MTTKTKEKTRNSLELLFSSRARDAVLRLFMTDPSRSYYQRQIEQATGQPIRAVQREVERLSKLGLLYRREEGNRIYYHVDHHHLLYPELRAMVLKTADAIGHLRGWAALAAGVRLAFVNKAGDGVLVVTADRAALPADPLQNFKVERMTEEQFIEALESSPDDLAPFLEEGLDLLGRRDDAIWRRIGLAGFEVKKAQGVA